jgi:CheY-like chemotaxis protein
VAGTAEELREALLNLLNNALDSMPAGGTFTFRADAEGDRVVVRAADGGCGMSEETRRRVFEPFFTTKGAQGNGLGLAVVWGIIARHGGEISVESTLGQGTTFTIRLPIPSVLPVDQGPEDGSLLPRGTRVLVVEDNVEILRSLGDLLRENGCRVIEAPNGMAALARIEAEAVDLVLTDLAMPGVSGWEVASASRERHPDTPVGLVTGFGDQLDPEKLERHGIQFVVAKPFSSEELLQAVAIALKGLRPGPAEQAGRKPAVVGRAAAVLRSIHEETATVITGALADAGQIRRREQLRGRPCHPPRHPIHADLSVGPAPPEPARGGRCQSRSSHRLTDRLVDGAKVGGRGGQARGPGREDPVQCLPEREGLGQRVVGRAGLLAGVLGQPGGFARGQDRRLVRPGQEIRVALDQIDLLAEGPGPDRIGEIEAETTGVELERVVHRARLYNLLTLF